MGDCVPREMTHEWFAARQNPAYRSMARTHLCCSPFFIAAALVAAAACTPARSPRPADGAVAPVVGAPPNALSFSYTPGPQRFRLWQRSHIYAGDTAAPARTIETQALVTIRVQELPARLIITTSVDSGGSLQPGSVATTMRWDSVSVDTVYISEWPQPQEKVCTTASLMAPPAWRFFVPVPHVLTPELARRDSVETVICQGTIPVLVRAVTNLRAVAETMGDGARPELRGESSYTLSGSGVTGQHNVRLTGSGTGTSSIVLRPARGTLRSAEEQLRLSVDVTASGRTLTLIQRTETRLTAID